MELNWHAQAGGRSYLVQTYRFGDLWAVSVPELPVLAYADGLHEIVGTACTSIALMLGVEPAAVAFGGGYAAPPRQIAPVAVELVRLDAIRGLAELRRRNGLPERRNGSFSRASRQCSLARGPATGPSRTC